MNAIINNNITYKVTSERGVFYVTEDNRGKVKMFLKSEVTIVEIDEMPKAKVYKQSRVSQAVLDREYKKFQSEMHDAELRGNFLDCQIKSGNYNKSLIK